MAVPRLPKESLEQQSCPPRALLIAAVRDLCDGEAATIERPGRVRGAARDPELGEPIAAAGRAHV